MKLRPLVNRARELALLERAWDRCREGEPQLVIVWGRRRVGKTFLLSHFVDNKESVFYGATQQSQTVELRRLFESLRRDLGDQEAELAAGGFTDWEAALRFLAALAATRPLVVVLDEVPYLEQSTPGFPSIVQNFWDHLRRDSKLMLVLTGSAVSTVERFMSAGAPLRGRATERLRLEPLDLWAAADFLPRLSAHRLVEAYAACGGYPLHLSAWDQNASTEANLLRLAGSPGGVLLEDAASILREELPETGGYSRILAAIGRGLTRYSEIKSAADQRIDHPLKTLVESGFVEKSLPVGAPKGARADYEVRDPYILFWFSVLYSDVGLIQGGQGRAVLRRARPRFETHVGRVFEGIARAHAANLVADGELPEDLVIGRWWASSGEPCEVDVLGLRGKKTHLIGEARWRRTPLGVKELEVLRRKLARVPRPVEEPVYAFWTRVGASPKVVSSALVFDAQSILASRGRAL